MSSSLKKIVKFRSKNVHNCMFPFTNTIRTGFSCVNVCIAHRKLNVSHLCTYYAYFRITWVLGFGCMYSLYVIVHGQVSLRQIYISYFVILFWFREEGQHWQCPSPFKYASEQMEECPLAGYPVQSLAAYPVQSWFKRWLQTSVDDQHNITTYYVRFRHVVDVKKMHWSNRISSFTSRKRMIFWLTI